MGKSTCRVALNFRHVARHLSRIEDVAKRQSAQLGARSRIIEPNEDLPGFDDVAFANENILDHAAFEMLDDLVLAGGHEKTGCDDSSGYQRRVRPKPEAQHRERNGKITSALYGSVVSRGMSSYHDRGVALAGTFGVVTLAGTSFIGRSLKRASSAHSCRLRWRPAAE